MVWREVVTAKEDDMKPLGKRCDLCDNPAIVRAEIMRGEWTETTFSRDLCRGCWLDLLEKGRLKYPEADNPAVEADKWRLN
jgi:hypothetical protein